MSKRSKRRNRKKQRALQQITIPNNPEASIIGEDVNEFERVIRRLRKFYCGSTPPKFERDTRALDEWVHNCVFESQWLTGLIDQASMIHANRNYAITGGPVVVRRFKRMLAESSHGRGFRQLVKMAAMQYYMSNFGSVIGLHRPSRNVVEDLGNGMSEVRFSPVDLIYTLDPLNFSPNLSFNADEANEFPWFYQGDKVGAFDIMRVVSMPDYRYDTFGIGRSAAYRCCQTMLITSAIYHHVHGVLDPNMIKGFVTISGYDEHSFEIAKRSAHEQGEGSLLLLFNPDTDIDIKFQACQGCLTT